MELILLGALLGFKLGLTYVILTSDAGGGW